jgi:hypothetical protein
MDRRAVESACSIGLCPRCLILFLEPRNEKIIQLPEDIVVNYVNERIEKITGEHHISGHRTCPCCFDSLRGEAVDKFCGEICQHLEGKHMSLDRPLHLKIVVPPMIDAARLTCRTVVTKTVDKSFPFPTLKELLHRLVKDKLQSTKGFKVVDNFLHAEAQVSSYR